MQEPVPPADSHIVSVEVRVPSAGLRTPDEDGPTPTQLARAAALVEIGIVVGLFLLWRTLGLVAGHHTAGAVTHGRSVWDAEQTLHLPSEVALQRRFLPHPGL